MIARVETAVSNYGDRCPSLGRRAKTNKRVPPVILDRLLVFLFGCLLHENLRSQASRASSLVDPNEAIRKRSSYWPSVAGGTDRLENALLRRTIDVRPKKPSLFFSWLKNMYEWSTTYTFIRNRSIAMK